MLKITQELLDEKYNSLNDINEPFELDENLKIKDSMELNLNNPFITKLPNNIYFQPKGDTPTHFVLNISNSGITSIPKNFNPHIDDGELEIYVAEGQLMFVPEHLKGFVFAEKTVEKDLVITVNVPTESEWFAQQPLPYCSDLVAKPKLLEEYREFVVKNADIGIFNQNTIEAQFLIDKTKPRYAELEFLSLMNNYAVNNCDLNTRLSFEFARKDYNTEKLLGWEETAMNAEITRIELLGDEFLAVGFSDSNGKRLPIFYNCDIHMMNNRTAHSLCTQNEDVLQEELIYNFIDDLIDRKIFSVQDLDDDELREKIVEKAMGLDNNQLIKVLYDDKSYGKLLSELIAQMKDFEKELLEEKNKMAHELGWKLENELRYDGYELDIHDEDAISGICLDFIKNYDFDLRRALEDENYYYNVAIGELGLKEKVIKELGLEAVSEDNNYFVVDNTNELGFLLEKFGDKFDEDYIKDKFQKAFISEMESNYWEILKKDSSELSDEELDFIDEIRFGVSIGVEDRLEEELEEQLKTKNNQKQKY